MELTIKEESFCQAIAKYGEKEKLKAYKEAGYSTKMSLPAMHVQADKLFNKPKLRLRIAELRSVVVENTEKEFKYTVDWRLEKLGEIINAGLSSYEDGNAQKRREGLSAAKGALDTMNAMLGKGDDDKDAIPLSITFNVKEPVNDIKVTRGE